MDLSGIASVFMVLALGACMIASTARAAYLNYRNQLRGGTGRRI